MERQTTIGRQFTFNGKGLHTGKEVTMTLCPSEGGGFVFKRTDLEPNVLVRADARRVSFTQRGTVLSGDDPQVTVSTIEHLMSALRGCRVDNCLILIDGPEVPILDGSAKLFFDAIARVGVVELENTERVYLEIKEKIVYEEPDKELRIMALPEDYFCAQVNIDFKGSRLLAYQWAALENIKEYKKICDCRTFVFLHEVQFLLSQGLIKGGDLDNALVLAEQGITPELKTQMAVALGKQPEQINLLPSGVVGDCDLKYPNEPARHKLLDLIGDLALVGRPIKGRIIATRSGHGSNAAFARLLIEKYGFPE